MEERTIHKNNAQKWIIFLLGALFVVGVSYWQRGTIYNILNDFKLIPQPEHFTELYFDNAEFLPQAIVAHQPMIFSFTIHNVEGTSTVYPYIVYFESSKGQKTIFAQSSVTLADNASTSIGFSHTFASSSQEGEVVVQLTSLNNQSIDFLLPDNNE